MKTIVLLLALLASGAAGAQSFPSKPVTLVAGLAAGGPTDTIARLLAERMRQLLGRTTS